MTAAGGSRLIAFGPFEGTYERAALIVRQRHAKGVAVLLSEAVEAARSPNLDEVKRMRAARRRRPGQSRKNK